MSATMAATRVSGVADDESAGREIQRRRMRLGMYVTDLAKESGVNRNTIAAIEKGEVDSRDRTVGKLLSTLDRLEGDMARDFPDAVTEAAEAAESVGDELDLVEVRVTGPSSSWDVVVKGPVRDRAELADTAFRLVRQMRAADDAAQKDEPPVGEAP